MRTRIWLWVFAAVALGCSGNGESDGGSSDDDDSGAGSAGETGGTSGAGAAGGTSGTGATGGTTNGGAGGEAGETSGGEAGEPGGSGGGESVPLPPGSREVDGIVNLVDATAAAELEALLSDDTPVFVTRRQDLVTSFNLFVEHYVEDYDFVFFFTDHTVTNAYAAGIFQALNSRAEPGGTNEIEIALGGYRTDGRTKGAIVINYVPGVFGPLAHEVMHYWGNDLDPRFGFGVSLDEDYGPHWGFASVNGQLGGFDGATLRCETPANAMPPCTALPSGRTRYVVGDFAPFTNTYRRVPYSPLELYLMGLVPAADVPASFQVLLDGQMITRAAQTGGTAVVEAAAIDTVTFAEIVARHGQKAMLPATERDFRAAFVVISAEPASDATMTEIASFAATFGHRDPASEGDSFETHTGGRATLDTRLGLRRDTMTPPPEERELFECDVLAQNCPRAELGCYLWPPSFCALTGGVELDQPCDAAFACAPGLDCVASNANPTAFVCKPYCDPTITTGANACATLCPDTYAEYRSTTGEVLGGMCFPE